MGAAYKFVELALRIWNGPFHIGKLTQPTSVGDVMLKVLETLWRVIVVVVFAPAVALCLMLVWVSWLGPELFPPLKDQIEIAAQYDDGAASIISTGSKSFRCTKDYPLKVEFYNKSRKTVGDVSFSIEANAREHSTDLALDTGYLHFDGIMKPGYGWTQCYKITVQTGYDPANLGYHGKVIFASESKVQ